MKCNMSLSNVTPEQLPALMSTLTVLGISFNLRYHEDDDENCDQFTTPPTTTTSSRLQVTPMRKTKAKPTSNPSMLCAHPQCVKLGGFYNEQCHPRIYYCAAHKPNETYKTHKTFMFEGLRGHFCGTSDTSAFRKRVRPDDDGWLESRNDLKTPEKST
jgi:hypothetical protein